MKAKYVEQPDTEFFVSREENTGSIQIIAENEEEQKILDKFWRTQYKYELSLLAYTGTARGIRSMQIGFDWRSPCLRTSTDV